MQELKKTQFGGGPLGPSHNPFGGSDFGMRPDSSQIRDKYESQVEEVAMEDSRESRIARMIEAMFGPCAC